MVLDRGIHNAAKTSQHAELFLLSQGAVPHPRETLTSHHMCWIRVLVATTRRSIFKLHERLLYAIATIDRCRILCCALDHEVRPLGLHFVVVGSERTRLL